MCRNRACRKNGGTAAVIKENAGKAQEMRSRGIEVPYCLGNEGARQGPAVLLRPSGAAPVRIDEALDLDQVEDLDQVFVLLHQRADLVGQLGKSSP